VDLSQRRELNNGAGEALARAFELVFSPVIFGGIGWWIDSRLGTFPAITLALFLWVLGYLSWRQYRSYDAAMRREEAKMFGHLSERPASEDPHR
jgi:hypothetical protein